MCIAKSKTKLSRHSQTAGFTLIEVLTVVGILSLLIAAIVVVASGSAEKAAKKGTQGILNRLAMALESYHSEFQAYPPDGYDEPVIAPNGQRLKGSACLTYYLAWMYPDGSGNFERFTLKKQDFTDSDNIKMVDVNQGVPFIEEVKTKDELNNFGEFIDRFGMQRGNPLRYDNTEVVNGKSLYTPRPQTMSGASDPDPREVNNKGKPFFRDGYDLWSAGPDGGSKEAKADDDMISGRD